MMINALTCLNASHRHKMEQPIWVVMLMGTNLELIRSNQTFKMSIVEATAENLALSDSTTAVQWFLPSATVMELLMKCWILTITPSKCNPSKINFIECSRTYTHKKKRCNVSAFADQSLSKGMNACYECIINLH